MAKIKTAKNLVSNRNEYNSYYGDFRGVDFSSDHTQVANNRFAYLVNMYKDYKSANGTAIETIPGFRRMFSLSQDGSEPKDERINGIHRLDDRILVHVNAKLYLWENFPYTCGIKHTLSVLCEESMKTEQNWYQIDLAALVEGRGGRLGSRAKVFSVSVGEYACAEPKLSKGVLTFYSRFLHTGDSIVVEYVEDVVSTAQGRVGDLKDEKSTSFQCGKNLILLCETEAFWAHFPFDFGSDGRSEDDFLTFSFLSDVGITYIPTTHKGIVQGGDNFDTEYEQRNILSSYFYNEFYGEATDVQTLQLMLPAKFVDSVIASNDDGCSWKIDESQYSFDPDTNTVKVYTSSSKRVVFKVRAIYKDATSVTERLSMLATCTKGCLFDNRLFLSGNPKFPNTVYFSKPAGNGRLYFGADDWFNDGANNVTISAMIPVSDKLLVIKENAEEGGSAYLHGKLLTEDNVVAKAYPREQGLQGIGCIGAFTNFYDDPVFVSNLGVSALGQLSVRNERALEHRSTLIDAKLANMDLRKSFFVEWNGYLLLFVEGCIFMADSRQKYVDDLGMVQYEWYYIEGVGTYTGQTKGENGACEGGVFCPATCARTIQDNVYFGTDGGVVCGFNFDKRNECGDILPEWYTFDGRTIVSGCATKMDNCGIPHLTKSTVKKSMVIKIKALPASSLKIKVRTNTNPYKQVARIGSKVFSFETMDFDEFSFLTSDSGLFSVKEKEKKWVEKQVYLCSDEHMRPFALYYMAYRYFVAGRYKG